MTPERWRQITDVFHAALRRDPGDRNGYLCDVTGAGPVLKSAVDSLLAAHHDASQFGERPVSVATALLKPGTRVGPYLVECLVGVGRMGEVYRAQDPRLEREVALKVLPWHFAQDAERLASLRREARLLASLNHPHIGAIYGLERHALQPPTPHRRPWPCDGIRRRGGPCRAHRPGADSGARRASDRPADCGGTRGRA